MQRRLTGRSVLLTIVATLSACSAPAAPAPTPAPAAPAATTAPAPCPSQPRRLPLRATTAPAALAATAARAAPGSNHGTGCPAASKLYVEALALTNLPYFIDHRVGLEFAGKVLNAKTKFVGPVDYDMTAMVNTMDQALAENPSGMNVVGFDPALKPSIDKTIDAGIPVVTLDAEVYGSKRYTFLGTGNYNAGQVGAQLLAKEIGDKGKVAILTKVGQSNLEERIQGYKDEFAKNHPRHRAGAGHRRPERFGQGCRWSEGRAAAHA